MRTSRWPYTFVGTVLVSAAAVGCGTGGEAEAARQTLLATDRAWARTVGDAEQFAAFFTDDATFVPPEAPPVRGRATIREAVAAMLRTPGFSLTWQPMTVETAASGDLGYTQGAFTLSVTDSSGAPRRTTGTYLAVWRKQPDGQWKVVAHVFRPDAPSGGPGPVGQLTGGPSRPK